MTVRIPLIAANWKMNKTVEQACAFVARLRPALQGLRETDVVIAPPATALAALTDALRGSALQLAAQNVYPEEQGAFTGELSPVMLKQLGVAYVIVGHSERRTLFSEDDALVNRKVRAVFTHGLVPILCVGESLEQRQAGQTERVIETQLKENLNGVLPHDAAKLVVAYEPLWAIGTGQTATPEDAQAGCAFVRDVVAQLFTEQVGSALRVQYGGSVKPDNAHELLHQPDIDGALVGGASLDPDSFAKIVLSAHSHAVG